MGPSGQGTAESRLECLPRGRQSSANTGESSADQLFRPGESDTTHGGGGQRTFYEVSDVLGIVNTLDRFYIGERRWAEIKLTVCLEQLANEPILGKGELVSLRQRELMVIRIEKDGTHAIELRF
jgi:hypothetical protein